MDALNFWKLQILASRGSLELLGEQGGLHGLTMKESRGD